MKLKQARISWSESGHPYSDEYSDVYFSDEDPIGESHHVFIQGNQLETRFSLLTGKLFTLAELGFGTGLNFLVSWNLWNQLKPEQGQLHYIAFEKHPLTKQQLEKCLKLWPAYSSLSEHLLKNWPTISSGCHRILLNDSVVLDLHFGDALSQLSKINKIAGVDAWFFDGFSPSNNTSLWQQDITNEVARLSNSEATLASYSVSGTFRRSLERSGFDIQKLPGFGRKRHMLRAIINNPSERPQPKSAKPWNNWLKTKISPKTVAIIGGGLAGCSLAYSLKLRGINSCLYEAGTTIASGASGIPQFALRPRLFQEHSPLAEFYLQSYLFSQSLLKHLGDNERLNWHNCGVYQQQKALNKQSSLNIEQLQSLYPNEILDFRNHAASPNLNQANSEDLYFPHGGWVDPTKLCNTLLETSQATLNLNTTVTSLELNTESWTLKDSNHMASEFSAVVLANSQGIQNLEQTKTIPIQSLAGQVTFVKGCGESRQLNSVLCGQRTLFPNKNISNHQHLIAASYRRNQALDRNPGDDQQNLELMRQSLNDPAILQDKIIDSKVAIRSNSKDHIPLVGAIPNNELAIKKFGVLAQNAKADTAAMNTEPHYWPNLYISAAHGSNGLATCPFSAEIIASLINNEQLPINSEIAAALNPIRFIIRELKRQQN